MKEYEISYVSALGLTDEIRSELNNKIDKIIEDKQGAISWNSDSIRRRLIYPIQKQQAGFLRTIQASIDPAHIADIRSLLKKEEGVIRTSILQTTKREEIALSTFEAATKAYTEPRKAIAKPAKEMSEEEVEAKIKKALEEEVK